MGYFKTLASISTSHTLISGLYSAPSIYSGPIIFQNMSKSPISHLFCGTCPLH